jgi:Fe2+ transport system protein FeoA
MPHPLSTLSLRDARPGERLRVVSVLFDTMRARCAERGIHPGSEIRVLRRTAGHIHLALLGGGTASLGGDEAGFVEVRPIRRRPDPTTADGLATGPVAA